MVYRTLKDFVGNNTDAVFDKHVKLFKVPLTLADPDFLDQMLKKGVFTA